MPDDTTPANTTQPSEGEAPATPQPTVEQLQTRLVEAEARAKSSSADADQAKRYLVDLVARLGQNEAANQAPAQQQSQDATPEELLQEFKDNPVGLLDRHFAARMGPILHDHLDVQAKMNRQAFIDRNKDDWDDYGKEVDAFMSPMSMSTKAKPGSWEEGLNYIKAKHIEQIVEKRMKAKEEADKKSQLEGRGSSSGGGAGRGGRYRMSELEKSVAKGFNMTEEEWIKNRTPEEKGESEDIF